MKKEKKYCLHCEDKTQFIEKVRWLNFDGNLKRQKYLECIECGIEHEMEDAIQQHIFEQNKKARDKKRYRLRRQRQQAKIEREKNL